MNNQQQAIIYSLLTEPSPHDIKKDRRKEKIKQTSKKGKSLI